MNKKYLSSDVRQISERLKKFGIGRMEFLLFGAALKDFPFRKNSGLETLNQGKHTFGLNQIDSGEPCRL